MEKILFFDGYCVMCNGFIDFVLKKDKKNVLKFASLQGETAKKYIPDLLGDQLTTAVLKSEEKIFTESDAIIRSLIMLGGVFYFLKVLLLIPKKCRDFLYRIIANNRYRLFGKKEACRMPNKNEQEKILP